MYATKLGLTEREKDILKLLVLGKSNSEIGKELMISSNTVKAHTCSIFKKMEVDDRVQAAVRAVRIGLV